MSWWRYKKYVPVAKRRASAAREMAKRAKNGESFAPVKITGRKITSSFWGEAWCKNLQSYSDFSNRLPRGATYVRNGSVLDLKIEPGLVKAVVSGSRIYQIQIEIDPLAAKTWREVKAACAGQIGSIVELLQGRLSKSVMEIVTCQKRGLFPHPREIKMSCSCPDWAGVCKHIAATFYGIGARLDEQPELLFKLRQADHLELVEAAGQPLGEAPKRGAKKKTIAADALADVFGIELAPAEQPPTPAPAKTSRRKAKASAPLGNRSAESRSPVGKSSPRRTRRSTATQTASVAEPAKQTSGTPAKRPRKRAAKS